MNQKELEGVVLRLVLTEVGRRGERFVPVTSSNRHVHLSQPDVERLFGAGYRLTRMRDLAQPGQYACNETVTMECPKGSTTLRVVGPARKETQIELSYTDCFKLGVKPVLRMSGDTAGTPGCVLRNGDKQVAIDRGVIVAARHLHMAPTEAAAYGLKDGDVVALVVEGPRATTLDNLVVRSGEAHSLEAHIDKDEANACGLTDGELCRIVLRGEAKATGVSQKPAEPPMQAVVQTYVPATVSPAQPVVQTYVPAAISPAQASELKTYVPQKTPEIRTTMLDLSAEPHCYISEEDILAAERQKYKLIRHAADAIITPLARDAAAAKGISLIELI